MVFKKAIFTISFFFFYDKCNKFSFFPFTNKVKAWKFYKTRSPLSFASKNPSSIRLHDEANTVMAPNSDERQKKKNQLQPHSTTHVYLSGPKEKAQLNPGRKEERKRRGGSPRREEEERRGREGPNKPKEEKEEDRVSLS